MTDFGVFWVHSVGLILESPVKRDDEALTPRGR